MKLIISLFGILLFAIPVAQAATPTGWADVFLRIEEMPYICENESAANCGAAAFWEAVAQGPEIIPEMIELIADDRLTAASVPNFGGQYAVGDVALTVIEELIHGLPVLEILDIRFDEKGCGYCVYWQYLRNMPERRLAFRDAMRKWWKENGAELKWVEDDAVAVCDCRGPNPAGGYYQFP